MASSLEKLKSEILIKDTPENRVLLDKINCCEKNSISCGYRVFDRQGDTFRIIEGSPEIIGVAE